MNWFNRKKKEETLLVKPAPSSRVEVELHKGASQEAAAKATQTNQHLNELLVNNGFTLKIYLARGGQPHKAKVNKT